MFAECSDAHCLSCSFDAGVCQRCQPPYLILHTYCIMSPCPNGYSIDSAGFVCMRMSTGSGLSSHALAAVVATPIVFVVVCAVGFVIWRRRLNRKFTARETELKDRLLVSETEGYYVFTCDIEFSLLFIGFEIIYLHHSARSQGILAHQCCGLGCWHDGDWFGQLRQSVPRRV